MNRRAFFGLIAAAISLPSILALAERRRKRDIAAILALKEELSKNIKKTNELFKQIAKTDKRMKKEIGLCAKNVQCLREKQE
jgi:hypothetical protein